MTALFWIEEEVEGSGLGLGLGLGVGVVVVTDWVSCTARLTPNQA